MAVKKRSWLSTGGNNALESESAARLAPPEERDGASGSQTAAPTKGDGTVTIGTGELKLPQELTEEEAEIKRYLPMDPAVMAILFLSLLFILAIAFVLWSGWEPPRN